MYSIIYVIHDFEVFALLIYLMHLQIPIWNDICILMCMCCKHGVVQMLLMVI